MLYAPAALLGRSKPLAAARRRSRASLGGSVQINAVQQVIKSDTEWTGWFVLASEHRLIAAKGRKLHFDAVI